jgi:hypothetical protein
MLIKRYYRKKSKHNRTITDEFFALLIEQKGLPTAIDMDNASYDILFESKEERETYVDNSYKRVLANISYYLDNLEVIPTISNTKVLAGNHQNLFTLDGTLIKKTNNVSKTETLIKE